MNDDDMKSEMQNKKWSPGYLYILDYGDGKQFKVGITTKSPKTRADAIQRNAGMLLPLPIESELIISLEMDTNPYYLEQLLHMTLADKHIGGEWFMFDDLGELAELVSIIKPFGILEYFDRWYDIFASDDVFLSVHSHVYPSNLDYVKGLTSYMKSNKLRVRSHPSNNELVTEWEGKTRNNFARYGVKGVFNDYFSFKNTNEVQELGL